MDTTSVLVLSVVLRSSTSLGVFENRCSCYVMHFIPLVQNPPMREKKNSTGARLLPKTMILTSREAYSGTSGKGEANCPLGKVCVAGPLAPQVPIQI